MSQLKFYTKKKDKWVSFFPVLKDRIDLVSDMSAFFCENYVVSGSFGNVSYKLINMPGAKIMLIEMELNKQIRIIGLTDMNVATIAFCMKGDFLFHSSNSILLPVVRSQYIIDYNISESTYEVILKTDSKKTYQLLILVLDVQEKLKKYIERIDFSIRQSRAFTNSIDMHVLLSGINSEIRKIGRSQKSLLAYLHLIFMVAINIAKNFQLPEEPLQIENRHEEKMAYKMAEAIILDLEEPWTLKKLAEFEKTNITNIKWLFKKYIGLPVTAFRILVRLQKAKQLLAERKLSIQEISISVGYANPGQFASMFKRKIGCSPSEFRKRESLIHD